MEKRSRQNFGIRFERSDARFASLPTDAIKALTPGGSDLSLIVSSDGRVLDVAFDDPTLEVYGVGKWRGKLWSDTVTRESVEKITALLKESAIHGESRPHQVNHPCEGKPDLPVAYKLHSIPGVDEWQIAHGRDLRNISEMQQQLVQSQMELDREYRRIRDTETRYRAAFQKLAPGMLIVSGMGQKILDANISAARFIGISPSQLAGQPLKSVAARQDRQKLSTAMQAATENGTVQTLTVNPVNGEGEIDIRIDPYRERGAINAIIQISTPSGSSLTPSRNAQLRAEYFDTLPEAFAIVDQKGILTDLNDVFLDLIHSLNRETVIGRNINNWLGNSNVETQLLLNRTREEGHVRNFASTLRDGMGRDVPVRISAAAIENSDTGAIALMVNEQIHKESQLTVSTSGTASASSDFSELVGRVPLKDLIREAADVIEKLCIEAALRQTGNNRASAAEILGLSRQSLYIKLRRYGLESFDGQD